MGRNLEIITSCKNLQKETKLCIPVKQILDLIVFLTGHFGTVHTPLKCVSIAGAAGSLREPTTYDDWPCPTSESSQLSAKSF